MRKLATEKLSLFLKSASTLQSQSEQKAKTEPGEEHKPGRWCWEHWERFDSCSLQPFPLNPLASCCFTGTLWHSGHTAGRHAMVDGHR